MYQFLPSLNLDEYEALRESIRENGVIEPIITDEDGNIIDGHHRAKVCAELGIECPMRVIEGLTEERKQDMSLELNMHRRQLTKEQKKELAITLREQGWTQERIGKALGTPRTTIADWIKFDETVIANQSSPKPDPELERLRNELADRDNFERQQEEETQRLREELESLRNAPAPSAAEEPSFEMENELEEAQEENRRLREELETLKNAPMPEPVLPEIEQDVIDEIVEQKLEARLAELAQQEEDLRQRNEELEQRRQEAEAKALANEKELESLLAEKAKEIKAAAETNQDIGELQNERESLQRDLDTLRGEIANEQKTALVREKIKEIEEITQSLSVLVLTVKTRLVSSGNCCGMGAQELEDLMVESQSAIVLFAEVEKLTREQLEKLQAGEEAPITPGEGE